MDSQIICEQSTYWVFHIRIIFFPHTTIIFSRSGNFFEGLRNKIPNIKPRANLDNDLPIYYSYIEVQIRCQNPHCAVGLDPVPGSDHYQLQNLLFQTPLKEMVIELSQEKSLNYFKKWDHLTS